MVDRENFEDVLFGPNAVLEGAFFRTLISSDVRMSEKPCAIELKMVIFCSGLCLLEIIL